MSLHERAIEILTRAEMQLQDLMKEGLDHQLYEGIADVARVAERVNLIVAEEDGTLGSAKSSPGRESVSRPASIGARDGSQRRTKTSRRRPVKSKKPDGYPYFERADDRLVKVGWSARDGRPYEHRAPKAAIETLARAIRESTPGEPFTMLEILPQLEPLDEDLPSYQAYLALAWLRDVGAVKKAGRTGYVADSAKLAIKTIEGFWESIPERGAKAEGAS